MSIVRQIDRVLLHSDAPEALFGSLSGMLALPVVEPFRPQGTFASGLVCAGNVSLEPIRLGPPSPGAAGNARLFGVALQPESLPEAIAELDARGIAHGAPAPYPHEGEMRRWTNVAIDSMLVGGMVFLCEYDDDPAPRRIKARTELSASNGGPLGINALRSIDIETRDIVAAIARWDALLSPAISPEPGTWICGDGPALRVFPGDVDAITSLTFDVRSLDVARRFLSGSALFGGDCGRELRIARDAVQGLDLRFREARERWR